jgi:hypothetical protein
MDRTNAFVRVLWTTHVTRRALTSVARGLARALHTPLRIIPPRSTFHIVAQGFMYKMPDIFFPFPLRLAFLTSRAR